MRWPDFSSYGMRAIVASFPDGIKRLVMMGGDRHPAELQRLGFTNKGGLWFRRSLNVSADYDAFKKEFPRLYVRETQHSDIVRTIKQRSNVAPTKAEVETKIGILGARLLGRNRNGHEVYEGADGRFIRTDDSKTILDDGATPHCDFLRVDPSADGDAIYAELDKCAEGIIFEIVHGKVFRGEDIRRFVEVVTVNRSDIDITAVHDSISAAMFATIRNSGLGASEDGFRLAVKLHEGMPPLDNEAEKSTIPFPIGLVSQGLIGTDLAGKSVLADFGSNGSMVSSISAANIVANGSENKHFASSISATDDSTSPDYVLCAQYGAVMDESKKRKGIQFERADYINALDYLDERSSNGKAVLIVGTDGAHQGKFGPEGSRFINAIAARHHIESVVELDGALFGRSGYNTNRMMVVVGDRGPGNIAPEKADVVRDYGSLWSWSQDVIDARSGIHVTGRKAIELDENNYQSPYVPVSQVSEPIAMIPRNLVGPTRKALAAVEERHGDIDEWVADKLQYDRELLGAYLDAEQVDAVALAIDAFERGRGFIEADKTGMGKGRVLAALARYAALHGLNTVFITEKDNLFSDFWRDIMDTGSENIFNPFILNNGIPITDPDGTVVFKGAKKENTDKAVAEAMSGINPMEDSGHNIAFATYGQFNRKDVSSVDPNNPGVVIRQPSKNEWLKQVSKDALVILDESHNASGKTSNTGENIRKAIGEAASVAYSSATFAKDAANMEIYWKALPDSIDRREIGDALVAGGEPLQEVFCAMLAEDGVLIRREHDLSDLQFETDTATAYLNRNEEAANAFAGVLEAMGYLAGEVAGFVSQENYRLKENLKKTKSAGQKPSTGIKKIGMFSSNFGSALYALMRQFQLSMNIDYAADMAISSLEAGRKPIIFVEQTGESLLRSFIDDNAFEMTEEDAEDSQAISEELGNFADKILAEPVTFRDVLKRALNRMVVIGKYNPDGTTSMETMQTDSVLRAVAEIEILIESFPDMPASPIDILRDKIGKAGYACGELTGRSIGISQLEDGTYAVTKPAAQWSGKAGRNKAIREFNNGEMDAIVISTAGSTGISLHAGEKFADWRQREMIELQIANNVATRIQVFGRANRKGQVSSPIIRTISSGIPAETRLISMQNDKLRKLSANTTSNRDDAALSDAVVDILNPVGNEVCRRFLESNMDITKRLSIDASNIPEEIAKKMADKTWFANQLTARMGMLRVDEQRRIYDDINSEYHSVLQDLENRGINPLKSKEFDYRATVVSREVFEGAELPSYKSVFDMPVYKTVINYKVKLDSVSAQTVRDMVTAQASELAADDRLAGMPPEAPNLLEPIGNIIESKRQSLLERSLPKDYTDVSAALAASESNSVQIVNQRINFMTTFLKRIRPGVVVRFTGPEMVSSYGVVAKITMPEVDREHLGGQYEVRILIPGQPKPHFTTLAGIARDNEFRIMGNIDNSNWLMSDFDRNNKTEMDVTKIVLDGNIFNAAMMSARTSSGVSAVYTDAEGVRQRGIVMPVSVQSLSSLNQVAGMVPVNSAGEADAFFNHQDYGRRRLCSAPSGYSDQKDVSVSIDKDGTGRLYVPRNKSNGAQYMENEVILDIVGSFSNGTSLQASGDVPAGRVRELMDELYKLGLKFYADSNHRDEINMIRMTGHAAHVISSPAP